MKEQARYIAGALYLVIITSCSMKEKSNINFQDAVPFKAESISIKTVAGNQARGQVVYLPIYSNIPHLSNDKYYDLSGFAAIHNIDLEHSITLTKVLFFNNDGKIVQDFLPEKMVLAPLGATNFYIPESDKSGTGANFLIEWQADTIVSCPLIQSIMVSLTTGQGISFLSEGRVIRELQ